MSGLDLRLYAKQAESLLKLALSMRTELVEIKIRMDVVAVSGCSHSLQYICLHQHAKIIYMPSRLSQNKILSPSPGTPNK